MPFGASIILSERHDDMDSYSMRKYTVRPLGPGDVGWAIDLLTERWGTHHIVTRGRSHAGDELPGFVAVGGNKPIGLSLYKIEGEYCELVSLDSIIEGIGVGSALVEAVEKAALEAGCIRLWLITTNDNLKALGFYQRKGFRLTAVYPNALERSRKMKPEIPLTGMNGIPLSDEMELVKRLTREGNSSAEAGRPQDLPDRKDWSHNG